ncbi:hypothetical protein [Streptomyces sp. NPDC053048]|uniref:hypothetical protein n=1 Tax=Streptomyces sp. NPDC053048 TaxID=3365694 RepID=UPI0037D119C3
MCLLLDNATSADQIWPLLPGGHGHLVAVTSRELLAGLARDGAALHQLRLRDPEAATEYLARCLGSGRIAREPDAARQITAATHGLPLALGLAVTELAAHPGRPLTDILAPSAHPGPGPAPRQRRPDSPEGAMTTGLDRTYWNLPRDVARVYRRLGLLPLPETDTALTAAACNLPAGEADRALRALSAARLLEDVADQVAGTGRCPRTSSTTRPSSRPRGKAAATRPLRWRP